jgi:hypothetical protein
LDAIAFKPFEITDTGILALYAMTILTTTENIKRRIICPPWKIEQETIGKYSGWSAKLELWQYEVC